MTREEALNRLKEAEDNFLLAYGWKKWDNENWESPDWYRKRTTITSKWNPNEDRFVPLENQNLYKHGYAVNSLKANYKGAPK